MNDQVKPITIKADVMWAFLTRQNELSGKYQVDLTNLSAGAVTALESMGLKVKNKDDRGSYITCSSRNPIKAYNPSSDEIPGDIIGNGSKARAVVGFYDWTFSGKAGRSPSLLKLVVDELEMYEGGEGSAEVGEAL